MTVIPQDSEQFEFLFKSAPDIFLDLTEQSDDLFSQITIIDSIFNFYPYAEIYFRDNLSIIREHAYFVEGLEFNMQLGNNEDGYLENNYCWSENQYGDIEIGNHLSGTNAFILLSSLYKKDYKRSRAFSESPISSIVRDILQDTIKGLGVSNTSLLNIATTVGSDKWSMMNETYAQFIQRLAQSAYSQTYNKSPFLTFFNLAGEFYFQPLAKMYEQTPINETPYILSWGGEDNDIYSDEMANIAVIKDYNASSLGMPTNKHNYKKKGFWLDEYGNFQNREFDISDYLIKHEGKGKFLLRKSDQTNIRDRVNLGLYNSEVHKNILEGVINHLFVDSLMSYRMDIVLQFNNKLNAGKVIKLEIDSADEEKGGSSEYSGNWLILESEILKDSEATRGIPLMNLTIAKCTIDIDSNHKFYNDFLG